MNEGRYIAERRIECRIEFAIIVSLRCYIKRVMGMGGTRSRVMGAGCSINNRILELRTMVIKRV